MKQIVNVYKSRRKEGAYIYTAMNYDTKQLPEALIALFGAPELAMKIVITPDKALAQTSGEKVLAAIDEHGFFLQLPKPDANEMQAIADKNSKLPRHG